MNDYFFVVSEINIRGEYGLFFDRGSDGAIDALHDIARNYICRIEDGFHSFTVFSGIKKLEGKDEAPESLLPSSPSFGGSKVDQNCQRFVDFISTDPLFSRCGKDAVEVLEKIKKHKSLTGVASALADSMASSTLRAVESKLESSEEKEEKKESTLYSSVSNKMA